MINGNEILHWSFFLNSNPQVIIHSLLIGTSAERMHCQCVLIGTYQLSVLQNLKGSAFARYSMIEISRFVPDRTLSTNSAR